jgi:ribosome recycling factor
MAFDFATFHLKAQKALDHVQEDIGTLRTGRASVQLLDSVVVPVYGSGMKVSEVAQISAPEPTLLVVKPWDQSIKEQIEKAIASAGLNLNPVVDGDIIRIMVPPLTEERRKEMIKLLHQKIETGRVMLRSIRTDIKGEVEDQKGTANVSEDDIHREVEQLNKLIQEYMDKLDSMATQKEKELLTV